MSNTITNRTVRHKRGEKVSRDSKRVPLSGVRPKMHINESELDPNFHYAWINDTKGLIFDAKRAGYEHVTTSEVPQWGVRGVDSANAVDDLISMPVGQGVIAFLMKQPMEFYLEDREALDDMVDAREADLKRELNSGNDGKYGKVSIERQI